MAIYHLIFLTIPPILLASHFRHASWLVRLQLEPSLLLLQSCPLCDDVSKFRFIDLSRGILLRLIRSLSGVLVRK